MAELSEDLKVEVVCRLAAYEGPAEIVAWLKAECDTEATIRQIMNYDPSKPYFAAHSRFRDIFAAARRAYIEQVIEVPIANQGFRLAELNKHYLKAAKGKNTVLAMSLLEQAAKEIGGIYSNVRHHALHKADEQGEYTPLERKQRLGTLIDNALGPLKLVGPSTKEAA